MASIPPKLAAMGKQLVGGSSEEIGQLAKSAGTLVPTTPLDALAVGANVNQAKMAGGEPNIRNALKLSTQESDVDKEARTGRVTARGDDVQTRLQGAGALATMASLYGRVGAAVDAQLKANQGDIGFQTNESMLKGALQASGADEAAVRDKLTKLQTETDPKERIKLVAELQRDLKVATLAGIFGLDTDGWAKKVASMTPDDLLMKFVPSDILDKSKLAADLGISREELDSMTYADAKTKAVEVSRTQFKDVDALQRLVNDPTAPKASRDMAAQRLSELNLGGNLQYAEQTRTIAQSIMNPKETVSFGGQSISLQEALSDETISKALTAAAADPNSLDGTIYSGFKQFVLDHQDELKQLGGKITAAEQAVTGRIEAVTAAGNIGGVPLTDNVISILFPDLKDKDVMAGVREMGTGAALYKTLQELVADPRTADLGKQMTAQLSTLPDEILKWMRDADKKMLDSWLQAPGIANNPQAFGDVIKRTYTLWNELNAEKPNAEAIHNYVQDIFSSSGIDLDMLDDFDSDVISAAGGLGTTLDADKDGKLDAWPDIAKRLTSEVTTKGPEAIAELLELPKKLDIKAIWQKNDEQKILKAADTKTLAGMESTWNGMGNEDFVKSLENLPPADAIGALVKKMNTIDDFLKTFDKQASELKFNKDKAKTLRESWSRVRVALYNELTTRIFNQSAAMIKTITPSSSGTTGNSIVQQGGGVTSEGAIIAGPGTAGPGQLTITIPGQTSGGYMPPSTVKQEDVPKLKLPPIGQATVLPASVGIPPPAPPPAPKKPTQPAKPTPAPKKPVVGGGSKGRRDDF